MKPIALAHAIPLLLLCTNIGANPTVASAEIMLINSEENTDPEITIGPASSVPLGNNWHLSADPQTTFWPFKNKLISAPLIPQLAESTESALQAGLDIYTFSDIDTSSESRNRIDNWSANFKFAHQNNLGTIGGGIGYINDISVQHPSSLGQGGYDFDDPISGWTANIVAKAGRFSFVGKYIAASDNFLFEEIPFKGTGFRPQAWNAEAGFGFSFMGRDSTLAAGYQGTKEALDLGLPKRRWQIGWSIDLMDNTALSFEWAHDKDYSISDGGTGEYADTISTQIQFEFQ